MHDRSDNGPGTLSGVSSQIKHLGEEIEMTEKTMTRLSRMVTQLISQEKRIEARKNNQRGLVELLRGLHDLRPMILDRDSPKLYGFLSADTTYALDYHRIQRLQGRIIRLPEETPLSPKDLLFVTCPCCQKEHPVIINLRYLPEKTDQSQHFSEERWHTYLWLACANQAVQLAYSLYLVSIERGSPLVDDRKNLDAYDSHYLAVQAAGVCA